VTVVGPRQAGKTTLLRELQPKANSNYLLFDDSEVRRTFDSNIKKFETEFINGFDRTLLDEVHYGQDAGSKLKYLVDVGHRLWVTASSETLLAIEILSYLVGRVGVLRLYPFSLPEFLKAKQQRATVSMVLERLVWEHLTYGGYPEVVLTESTSDKRRLMTNLCRTILLKDVAVRYRP